MRAGAAVRMVGSWSIMAAFVGQSVLSIALATPARAGTTAECDALQLDNEWRARDNEWRARDNYPSIPAGGPYATAVYGTINYVNYGLCFRGLSTPMQSGSGARVAVVGNVYAAGHCYPWAQYTQISGNAWDVWTTSSHGNC